MPQQGHQTSTVENPALGNCQCQLLIYDPTNPGFDPGEDFYQTPQSQIPPRFTEILAPIDPGKIHHGRFLLWNPYVENAPELPLEDWIIEAVDSQGRPVNNVFRLALYDVLGSGPAPQWGRTLVQGPTPCEAYVRFQFRVAEGTSTLDDHYWIRAKWPRTAPDEQAVVCMAKVTFRDEQRTPERDSGETIAPPAPRRNIFLHEVRPPDPLNMQGLPVPNATIGDLPELVWKRIWRPYAVATHTYEFEYFDLANAVKDPKVYVGFDANQETWYECENFTNAKMAAFRVSIVSTSWCQFKCCSSEAKHLGVTVLLQALSAGRILWAGVNLVRSAYGLDPIGVVEAIWDGKSAIESWGEPPQVPTWWRSDLDTECLFIRPLHRTRLSADWVLNHTNWATGTYMSCIRYRTHGSQDVSPTQSPDILPPYTRFTPDEGDRVIWQRDLSSGQYAERIPIVFDSDTSVSRADQIPVPPYPTDPLTPQNQFWRKYLRFDDPHKIRFTDDQKGPTFVSDSPCLLNKRNGYMKSGGKWYSVGKFSEQVLPRYFRERELVSEY